MLDIPRFEESRHALHETCHYRILSCNRSSEIIRDRYLDDQSQISGFFYLVAEFDDREESLARNTAPVQAHAAERVGLNDGHAGTKLGCPDRGNIATRPGAKNCDVLLGCH